MGRYFTLAIITLVFLLSLLVASNSLLVSSSNKEFNSTTETVYLNWTNNWRSNITIVSNLGNAIYLQVLNTSNNVNRYYGQPQNGVNPSYNSECGYSPYSGMFFDVANATGYSNDTFLLNPDVFTNISISPYHPCPSGRYYGYMKIVNATNTSEYINVTVIVDYPISAVRTRDMSNGVGQFKGIIQTNSSYHSYYFNTSEIENATSASINLSWSNLNDDVDLFLFNQDGVLIERSINRSTGESLVYSYLPTNQMWEIRVYGNSSSSLDYTSSGSLIFSTLSIKNSSSQQINLIDFGTMNVSATKIENMTLENVGNLNSSSIQESVEIYHIETSNANTTQNFSFIIPAFATGVRTSINWTGSAVYNISLYKPSGTIVGSSGIKRSIANMTKSMQEEFVESGSVGSSDEGVWRLEVKNTTPSATYTVQLKYWLPSSQWISSNYTTSNLTYFGNKTNYHFNFTVPNNTLSGDVYGNLKYRSSSGQEIQFSVKANVSTPVLMLNDTLNQGSITIRENIGENVTRTISIPITNNGTSTINFGPLVNSTNLTYGNYHMNFSTSYPSSLAPGQSGNINITVYVNTLGTGNNPGVYTGWVFLNATEARPYAGYTLTINVDLTRELVVNIIDFKTSNGNEWLENVSHEDNATYYFKVYYANGTTEITDLDLTNFTTAWFVEDNSNYRLPSVSNITPSVFGASNQTYFSGRYLMNATVPAGHPGGNYTAYIGINMVKEGLTYTGTGSNTTALKINNAAFLLANKSTKAIGEFNELTTVSFNASLKNIGTLIGSANIEFNNGTCPISVTPKSYSCEIPTPLSSISTISKGWSVTFDANYSTACYFYWELTGNNVSSNIQCTDPSVTVSNYGLNSISGISMTIKNIGNGSSSSSATTTTTIPAEEEPVTSSKENTTTEQFFDIDYETQIDIEQGKNYTTNINVANIYEEVQLLRVSILSINSSWVKVSPASYISLASGDNYIFRAIFTIPEDAGVNDYLGQIQVESKDHTDRKDFTLSILPGDKLKVEINEMLEKYENETLAIELKMNQTKIKGDNVTLIQNRIQVLHQMIAEAKAHISTGNYKSAYNLLDDIQRLLNETATRQNNLLAGRSFLGNYKWLLISIGIIAPASVAGYIYWPKYSPKFKVLKFKFKKPVREEKLEELKKIKENLKDEETKREMLKKEFGKLTDIEETLKKETEEIEKIKKDVNKFEDDS